MAAARRSVWFFWGVVFSAVLLSGCAVVDAPVAVGGVLDLRCVARPLRLTGEWEHYPRVFLDPARSPAQQGVRPALLNVPAEVRAPCWGTLRLRLRLSPECIGKRVAFTHTELNTAFRFFVNGRRLFSIGRPAGDSHKSTPGFYRRRGSLLVEQAECIIVIHFSNHELRNGFIAAPSFGRVEAIDKDLRERDIAQFLVVGALVMMLLYHLFLFLIRRDYSPLYFSIFTVCVILRLLLTEGNLYALFPEHAVVLMKLEYIMFFMMPPFFCLYLGSLKLLDISKTILYILFGTLLLSSLLTILLPLLLASGYILVFYQLFSLVFIIYVIRGLVRATRRRLDDIWLFNTGTLLLAVFATNDILHFTRIIHTAPLSHFGLVTFVFFQAAVIARRYNRVLANSEHLNKNLEELVGKKTAELRETVRALEEASLSDSLTGARNRRFVYEIVFQDAQALLQRWEYASQHYGLLMLDIDFFKKVNDEHGHDAGDRTLVRFAALLRECVRADDLVIRWGGEEFLIVLKNIDPEKLAAVSGKIVSRVRAEAFCLSSDRSRTIRISTSIGSCIFPFLETHPDRFSFSECLRVADISLYHSKHQGRDRWTIARPGSGVERLTDIALLDDPGVPHEAYFDFEQGR